MDFEDFITAGTKLNTIAVFFPMPDEIGARRQACVLARRGEAAAAIIAQIKNPERRP